MTPEESALAAIRAEKAFVKLSPADRDQVFAVLAKTRSYMETERRYDRYGDRSLRVENRELMKTHLASILKVLKVHLAPVMKVLAEDEFDALDWLTDHHRGDVTAAIAELKAFEKTGRLLLNGAKAFEPDVSRKGRDERQLRADLTRRAFYELIGVLDSVGVHVAASLGAKTRLLARLISYAVGDEVGAETVKDLVQQRRRSK